MDHKYTMTMEQEEARRDHIFLYLACPKLVR